MTDTDESAEERVLCPDCKKELGTFACKIRHVQINSGIAKAAKDSGSHPGYGFKDREGNKI